MPLDLAALTSSPGLPGAADRDYPATVEACAAAWADALQAYAAAVVPPSTTVAAAAAALEPALVAAFRAGSLAAIDEALRVFAVAVGAGMAPLYAPIAPTSGPGLAARLAGGSPPTRAAGVALVATCIDTWLRLGTATQVAPPFTVLPWS